MTLTDPVTLPTTTELGIDLVQSLYWLTKGYDFSVSIQRVEVQARQQLLDLIRDILPPTDADAIETLAREKGLIP